jgi:hypothetical protein
MKRDRDVERKRHQEKGMRGERDEKDKGTRDSKRKRCHMTEMSKVFFSCATFFLVSLVCPGVICSITVREC